LEGRKILVKDLLTDGEYSSQAIRVNKDSPRSIDIGSNQKNHLSCRFIVKVAFQSEVKGVAISVH
jgi:hypothetical protein